MLLQRGASLLKRLSPKFVENRVLFALELLTAKVIRRLPVRSERRGVRQRK